MSVATVNRLLRDRDSEWEERVFFSVAKMR
jgi:hypothetical protein